jgi:hypothetical protein
VRSGGLLRKVGRLGRMTVEDAGDLAAVFAQVASRQLRDTVVAARSRLARRRRATGEPPPTGRSCRAWARHTHPRVNGTRASGKAPRDAPARARADEH